ncbi:MAG: DNA helicase RecQ [Treponema sp.]|nr:DNA helicase RecQ [Treponema sp.]
MRDKYDILKNIFGYTEFRRGQEEVIDAILSRRDALAVMPTGAGKSLCYQIPALLMPGMTIVISPLISLMKDQVNALRESGCGAAFLNSSLTSAEYHNVVNAISCGEIKLLYIAPERLQKAAGLISGANVPMVVVDEAHCASQWGHDFRTSYLEIADFIQSGIFKTRPVTAAFTATATVKVRDDIEKILGLKKPFCITTGFDRPNLYFEVQKISEKRAALLACLQTRGELSGIIYCATRKAVEEVFELLVARGFSATRYHAGLADRERRKNQDDFLYDKKTVMVATNAFGMGIDKSNVSFVIHYNMPKNIESYYQEAGRAGRDGASADCILLYNGQDVQINKFLITHTEDENGADPKLVHHNLELLKYMTFYATTGDCLRKRLLEYFSDETAALCGHCSNCLTEFEDADVSLEGRKIVSCVYRLKERNRSFGKTMIIDILRGSKNEKIMSGGFTTLSTWGIMKDSKAQTIRAVIDFLIDEGILLLDDGEYPVLTMGNAGPLLRQEKPLVMKLPKDRHKPEPVETRLESKFNDQLAGEVDPVLLDQLKKLRREIATRESVPAYIVFADAALKDMCRKKPMSLVQFSGINGVGKVKLEKYGEMFVDAIRDYDLG